MGTKPDCKIIENWECVGLKKKGVTKGRAPQHGKNVAKGEYTPTPAEQGKAETNYCPNLVVRLPRVDWILDPYSGARFIVQCVVYTVQVVREND